MIASVISTPTRKLFLTLIFPVSWGRHPGRLIFRHIPSRSLIEANLARTPRIQSHIIMIIVCKPILAIIFTLFACPFVQQRGHIIETSATAVGSDTLTDCTSRGEAYRKTPESRYICESWFIENVLQQIR
jgi:hypothetical protein